MLYVIRVTGCIGVCKTCHLYAISILLLRVYELNNVLTRFYRKGINTCTSMQHTIGAYDNVNAIPNVVRYSIWCNYYVISHIGKFIPFRMLNINHPAK